MKKTYINPNLFIVNMATQQMLAASGDNVGVNTTPVDPNSSDGRGDDFDW